MFISHFWVNFFPEDVNFVSVNLREYPTWAEATLYYARKAFSLRLSTKQFRQEEWEWLEGMFVWETGRGRSWESQLANRMPRRGERRGRVRCSNLYASGCTFFSLMIEELWDLYASPRTVITPLPIPGQPRFHVYPKIMQKHHLYCSDSCCCQFPEAWTRHFSFHKYFILLRNPKK